MKNKICTDIFSIKKLENKDIVIEGWANKSVVDRGNDMLRKEAWILDNFKKNPVMLFNHDMSKPVGKVLDVQALDGGLWVKCMVSKSSDPMVSYVRDLVEEGILNSFSVGFDAKEETKSAEGYNDITKAELYEVSIVSLPMNQDSNFQLTSKSFEGLASYKDARHMVLTSKGALVASLVQSKLDDLGEGKEEAVHEMCEKAGCEPQHMQSVLAGDVTPVDEPVLAAMSEILGIPMDELKQLNSKDVANKETPPPAPAQTEQKPEEKAVSDVVAIKVLKTSFTSEKVASVWAEETGWKGDKVKTEGDYFVLAQVDENEFENLEEVELAHGVKALMGTRKQAAATPGGSITPSENPKLDDNPYLLQARQTNILLAVIVAKLDALIEKKPKDEVVPPPAPPEEIDESQFKALQNYADDVDKRLKKLGV